MVEVTKKGTQYQVRVNDVVITVSEEELRLLGVEIDRVLR